MDKKQYKVKYENGKLTPLEPIKFNEMKEGIVIFFDEEIGTFKDEELKESAASLSEKSLKKIWDNPEDEAYNDL